MTDWRSRHKREKYIGLLTDRQVISDWVLLGEGTTDGTTGIGISEGQSMYCWRVRTVYGFPTFISAMSSINAFPPRDGRKLHLVQSGRGKERGLRGFIFNGGSSFLLHIFFLEIMNTSYSIKV